MKTPYDHVPLLNTPVDLSYSEFLSYYSLPQGFPYGPAVRICLPIQETGVLSLDQEDPLEKEMTTHCQYFCLGNPMDRGAWRAIVHGLQRVRCDLVIEQQQKHSLSP